MSQSSISLDEIEPSPEEPQKRRRRQSMINQDLVCLRVLNVMDSELKDELFDSGGPKGYEFHIATDCGRVFILRANNAKEKREWIVALCPSVDWDAEEARAKKMIENEKAKSVRMPVMTREDR